jgi:hypothetical protein
MADIKLNIENSRQTNFPTEKVDDQNIVEFLKTRCEILEKDLFKSQTQIKRLELSLKKAQELISKNAAVYLS